MTDLPSREAIGIHLDDWTPPIDDTPFGRTLRAYASGELLTATEWRDTINTEQAVERMAESRYNARFGGFAWTDPNHVTEGYTRDAFMASARRDLAAAIGDTE